MIDRPLHMRIANKPALGTAASRDRPCEPRFYRIGCAIDVMPIKAEACLKPERIPRAEANRANVRLFS